MKRSIVDHRLADSMAKALSCRAGRQRRAPGGSSRRGRGVPVAHALTTCERRTPMARKEALGYCRRCLAVMLCCVLVFGLTVRTAPRAKAVGGLAAAAVAGSSGVAASDIIGSVLGLQALCAAGGVDLTVDVQDKLAERIDVAQRMGYKWGWQVDAYLRGDDVDEASKSEWDRIVERFKGQGGVAPGDSVVLSQHLAETIRQWSLVNFDFIDGALSFEDDFLFGENDVFVLTKADTSALESYTGSSKTFLLPIKRVGQLVPFYIGDLSASYTHDFTTADKIVWTSTYKLGQSGTNCSFNLKVNFYADSIYSGPYTFVGPSGSLSAFDSFESLLSELREYISTRPATLICCNGRIYAATVDIANGRIEVGSRDYLSLSKFHASTFTTTFTPTPNLTTPVAKDITMTVPADLPVVNVGEYSVPAIGTLTGEELTGEETGEKNPAVPGIGVTAADIEKAIADALPITGAIAGDQVVEDAMTEPDSLGAVFISKFPFSIPWDVVKAISLLAAPPVTPHWEVDFYAPLEGKWGFHAQGDTTVVIDFTDFELLGQVCRWTSTLFFIYALATATKRLIWTA